MLILEGKKDGFGILIEEFTETNRLVETTEDGLKKIYIEGLFSVVDKQLRNPRTYPKAIMEREVSRFQEAIRSQRSFGELKHPNHMQIDPDRISHIITELHWEGAQLYGKALLVDTPCGKIAKALTEAGKPGVSSRATGSVRAGMVQTDLMLKTWDFVTEPSVADSVMTLIREEQELLLSAGADIKLLEQFINEMRTSNKKKEVDKYIIDSF